MTDTTAADLRELAQPWSGGELTKSVIARAAKRAGIPYWRAFNIWYGKARRIEAHESVAIAEALDKKNREAARNELRDLQLRIARLESLLVQTDPEFHRPSLDVLRSQNGGGRQSADRLRGLADAVDQTPMKRRT